MKIGKPPKFVMLASHWILIVFTASVIVGALQ